MVLGLFGKKKSREQMELELGITRDYVKALKSERETRRQLESAERERKALEREEFRATPFGGFVNALDKYGRFEARELERQMKKKKRN